jgi:hypothetical protein
MSTSEHPADLALIDTNVLVYAADTTAAFHDQAKQLRDRGTRGGLPLVVSPQVICCMLPHPRPRGDRRSQDSTFGSSFVWYWNKASTPC